MSEEEAQLQLLVLRRTPDPGEAARGLAPLLESTPYEVGLRLAAARQGPAVLATSRDADRVDIWVSGSRGLGLEALRIDRARLLRRDRLEVRDWRLADGGLQITSTSNQGLVVRVSELEAVVQALEVERRIERQVSTHRRLALGTALATGGLILTKKETREQRFHHVNPLHRLALYPAKNLPTLWMAEERIRYSALPQPLAPSRGANFSRVVEMLRDQLASATFYDEQLLDHRRVSSLLGPAAGTSDDLALAMALIAEARPTVPGTWVSS